MTSFEKESKVSQSICSKSIPAKELETYGFYNVYIQKDRQEPDGCGIFYKHNVAELLIKNTIKYNDILKSCYDDDLGRDCVGIMVAFRLRDSTKSADDIGGLPNFYHPNDHLPLAAEFEIRKIKYA
ncbi:hypothetical protein QYF36_012562 [Acer negundo]|nr:hypothetical protein QYF36_012562 [Acer negundo]